MTPLAVSTGFASDRSKPRARIAPIVSRACTSIRAASPARCGPTSRRRQDGVPAARDAAGMHRPGFGGWEERVRASFARQGFMAHLGARIVELAPGTCALEVEFGPHLTQQHGLFHAGVTTTLADNAGGYAAYTLFPEGTEVLTVELKVSFIAPAAGSRLRAVGSVLRHGRRLTTCEVRVTADGEDGP